MGGFSLGCGLGWSAPCVEILRSDKYDIEVIYVDVIASIFTVGAAVGTLLVPTLMDRVGRKRAMLMLTPFFIGGWIMLICAGSLVPLFVIGRILTGSCGGMFSVLVPMYTAEISEQQIRGYSGILSRVPNKGTRSPLLDSRREYPPCESYRLEREWESVARLLLLQFFLSLSRNGSLRRRRASLVQEAWNGRFAWDKNAFTMRRG